MHIRHRFPAALVCVLFFLSISVIAAESADDIAALYGEGMPYDAFDALPLTRIQTGGAELAVGFGPGEFELPKQDLMRWIENSAEVVAAYFGGFPVKRARILILPVGDGGVRFGASYGGERGAAIKVLVGQNVSEAELDKDWIMVHEMVHLAFPIVPRRHHWIEEGVATYIESIARMQSGQLTPEFVWRGLTRGLPKGLPGPGDQGLDNTPTWGRTFWGGALFCLLADIEIHRRTHNRYGLRDALRGIQAAGGSMEVRWPLAKALEAGDRSTGVTVLSELYQQHSNTPVNTDLPALWRQLGVSVQGDSVNFDESAPSASIRRAISAAAEEE